jgi:hypothetical protein
MGYTTEFRGKFSITPKLTNNHKKYLIYFSDNRHVKWDVLKLQTDIDSKKRSDILLKKVGLPLGNEGKYFTASDADGRGYPPDSILDYNQPPYGVPGLWLGWIPNETGTQLKWNLVEKFYYYREWLQFLIDEFFKPWGYTLNGEVHYYGEDEDDYGIITIKNNVMEEE